MASWASYEALNGLWFAADIATMKDIHAAYVRGSVATFAQESDDILNQTFFDEVRLVGTGCALGRECVWGMR